MIAPPELDQYLGREAERRDEVVLIEKKGPAPRERSRASTNAALNVVFSGCRWLQIE